MIEEVRYIQSSKWHVYNLLRIVTTRVVVPEHVSTGLYDWLKTTGDEMEMIDGISFVWNDTGEVSADTDKDGPIVSIIPSTGAVHADTDEDGPIVSIVQSTGAVHADTDEDGPIVSIVQSTGAVKQVNSSQKYYKLMLCTMEISERCRQYLARTCG